MEELEEQVIDVIREQLQVSREKIKKESRFVEDLGADSLDRIELVMELEETYKISIPDEDAEKLTTVGSAIGYISKRVGDKDNDNEY